MIDKSDWMEDSWPQNLALQWIMMGSNPHQDPENDQVAR